MAATARWQYAAKVAGLGAAIIASLAAYVWQRSWLEAADRWNGLDQRVKAIESFVGDQRQDIAEIKTLLKERENTTDKQVQKNAEMLRRLMKALKVQE